LSLCGGEILKSIYPVLKFKEYWIDSDRYSGITSYQLRIIVINASNSLPSLYWPCRICQYPTNAAQRGYKNNERGPCSEALPLFQTEVRYDANGFCNITSKLIFKVVTKPP